MMCKCGSYAINDDPKGALCDKCFRDVKISTLKARHDELLAAAKNILEAIEYCGWSAMDPEKVVSILSIAIANAEKDKPEC